jgi:hypothetical protein
MKRWSEFAAEKPEMAEAGHALLYQFRVGLGYLASPGPWRRAHGLPTSSRRHTCG